MSARRIGILGYGAVGRYLARQVAAAPDLSLAFVYNRSADALADAPLHDIPVASGSLDEAWPVLAKHGADLVVEVAHATIVADFGALILSTADLYVASITALANPALARQVRAAAADHALYLPAGAAWGVHDVARLDRVGGVKQLNVSMRFHADALRLHGEPADRLAAYRADAGDEAPCLLFDGPVAELAPLAPNNVNTMTCLALAASELGPEGTCARLYAHKLDHAHIVEIEVTGSGGFHVHTRRYNPALPGAVTGDATYGSFYASLLAAQGHASGVHFC